MTSAEKLAVIAENMPKVYGAGKEAGQQAEDDRFWDSFQQNGERRNYYGAFSTWSDEIFKPKYPLVVGLNTAMFYMANIPEIPVVDCRDSNNFSNTFAYAEIMTIVRWLLKDDGSQTFSTPFIGCAGLVNIVIEGVIGKNGLSFQWAKKLSHDSFVSVINALSDTTSGLTVTFSNTAKAAAFTDEEWAELIATKSNWTISLV